MSRCPLPAVLTLLALAACATAPPPVEQAAPPDATVMLDSTGQRLKGIFVPPVPPFAAVLAERRGQPLEPNDRRLMDMAFERAFQAPVGMLPELWSNPLTHDWGEVDLVKLVFDRRENQICALFRHVTGFGRTLLAGGATYCRRPDEEGWRLDQLGFDDPPTAPKPVAPRRPRPAAIPKFVIPPEAPRMPTPPNDSGIPPDAPQQRNLNDILRDPVSRS